MKLTEIHKKLKEQNIETVVIIKYGNFYRVFNEDTYIIWSFTKYKVHDNRLGFPKDTLKKITDNLSSINTNYIIYENNNFKKYNFLNNQYNIILKISKKDYQKEEMLNKLKKYDCYNELEELIKKYE